ncbi:hypothetical protein NZL82_03940 [Sphingomonas sanguinis]|nr:hypothetical protein [Sphingomonas sp. LC-1]
MDAFMIVLVATLAGQACGRSSLLAAQLTERSGRPVAVLAGLVLAQALLAGVWIRLGTVLAARFTPETHGLFLAIALIFIGIGMMGPLPRSATPYGWPRLGVFGGALIGGGAILFADSGSLIVAAAAARSPLPWAALPGAAIGLAGAVLPAIILGERGWRRLPLRAMRVGLGVLMGLTGVVIALAVKGLI